MTTTRRQRLTQAAHDSFLELEERQFLQLIREWRDSPGVERSLLFGEGDGVRPFFVVAIEHLPVPFRTKHRGRTIVDAVRQALISIGTASESES